MVEQICEPGETWCDTISNTMYRCNSSGTNATPIGYCVLDATIITISVEASRINLGSSTVVYGYLKKSNGAALANKYVTIRWGPSSDRDQYYESVVTDSFGKFQLTILPSIAQTYYLSAYYLGDAYQTSVTSVYIPLVVDYYEADVYVDTTISIILMDTNPHLGDSPVIMGALKDEYGAGFGSMPVSIYVKAPGASTFTKLKTVMTDASGNYSTAFLVSLAGTYQVYVAFAGTAPTSGYAFVGSENMTSVYMGW
jgi:hypothetical protein